MPFAIYALALAAFAVGTAEFVISGILQPLATDLGITIPVAGLLVSAYAAGVAVGGPLLTIAVARFSQRNVLLGIMVLFAASQLLCAFAPDYNLLLVARLASACAHGAFFGAGSVYVAGIVAPERRGAAFSLFISGITLANLLGLPAGTWVGFAFGWRASFIAVGIIGAVAAIVIALRLPHTIKSEEHHATLREQFGELRHQQVWLSYLTIALVMVGALAFGTYQVPIMVEVTRLDPQIVPIYLLIGGFGSVLGIFLGGRGTDWKPMPTLLAVLLLQSALYFTMLFAMHDKVWMTVNLMATAIFGFAFSTPLQTRVINAASRAPNLASSLISTAFNVGIALGAWTGSTLLTAGVSYADLPAVGVVTSLLAAGTATLSFWLERRAAPAGAA